MVYAFVELIRRISRPRAHRWKRQRGRGHREDIEKTAKAPALGKTGLAKNLRERFRLAKTRVCQSHSHLECPAFSSTQKTVPL